MSELEQLKQQLKEAEATYKAMPKGCGCNKKGRERNAAKREYYTNVIKPLKAQIAELSK